MNASEQIESWAIVELMGHVKLAGRISEEEKFGTKLGRIDIPDGDAFVTRYFGGQSVYSITPVTEAVARQVSKNLDVFPVQPWDFPKAIASLVSDRPDDEDD